VLADAALRFALTLLVACAACTGGHCGRAELVRKLLAEGSQLDEAA
jgi:hypothetical protein